MNFSMESPSLSGHPCFEAVRIVSASSRVSFGTLWPLGRYE
jgi:hypothetical protein